MVIQAPSRISIARHTVGSSVIEDVINLMKNLSQDATIIALP